MASIARAVYRPSALRVDQGERADTRRAARAVPSGAPCQFSMPADTAVSSLAAALIAVPGASRPTMSTSSLLVGVRGRLCVTSS